MGKKIIKLPVEKRQMDALEKRSFHWDEIAKYFKVSKKIVAKDDLDRKLFESKDLRKNLLESGAVKQTKAITLEK